MTGFLDRLLHADKPQPLDVDTAAAMLRTTPGLLREFERSYHANVLDRKNAPTGPLGPDAKTVVESRSGHGLSDEALALDARIVRELLSDTGVIRFDGERLTTIPALAPVPEKYVTESDVNALQSGERPQLAGELIHRQIDAVNYPLLLDMWRRATDPKRSARQRHEAYGMFRTGLDLLDLDPVMYRMLDMNPASIGHWLPALVKANEGKTFFRIPKTTIAKAPLTLLQLSRVEYESLTAATLDVVDRWAQAAFRLKPDESYFLKTGTFSSKYDYRNTHVAGPHEVAQIGEYLLYIQSQAVEMAGPLNQPSTYGVSTRLKPSDYCKRELGMKQVKSRAWLERYWAASGFREPASCGAPADCQHGAHLVEDASLVLLRCLHVLIPESQGDLSLRRHADPVFHKTSQTGPVPFALIPDEAPLCTTRSKNVRHVAHAVKSRVRTIMLDRRVYRVAMQAKGGR